MIVKEKSKYHKNSLVAVARKEFAHMIKTILSNSVYSKLHMSFYTPSAHQYHYLTTFPKNMLRGSGLHQLKITFILRSQKY